MKFDLHPTTSRLVDYFKDIPPGTEVPRQEVSREFNQPWGDIDVYFRSARRILFREYDKLIRLATPRGTGPIVICNDAQKVEIESKHIRQTKLRTKRTITVSDTIDTTALEPQTRIKHEVNQFILSATHDLHRAKTFTDLSVKVASNEELKPTKELLKFLAS